MRDFRLRNRGRIAWRQVKPRAVCLSGILQSPSRFGGRRAARRANLSEPLNRLPESRAPVYRRAYRSLPGELLLSRLRPRAPRTTDGGGRVCYGRAIASQRSRTVAAGAKERVRGARAIFTIFRGATRIEYSGML